VSEKKLSVQVHHPLLFFENIIINNDTVIMFLDTHTHNTHTTHTTNTTTHTKHTHAHTRAHAHTHTHTLLKTKKILNSRIRDKFF
jgi:hypothetical protein